MNSVSALLKRDFSKLPIEEKLRIKSSGRPLPELRLSQRGERKSQNRTFVRHFSAEIYKRNNWICGCEVKNLLYCFPCVLFYDPSVSTSEKHWARIGIKDLHHLPDKIRKHESSRGHILACTELAFLGRSSIGAYFDSGRRKRIAEHNEKVKRNRASLKRIVGCVRFCAPFELSSRDDGCRSGGMFGDLIEFTAEFDVTLRDHLRMLPRTIKEDILDCMLVVCREEITNQIKSADFLSVECDETSDVTNWYQMVFIFRYVLEDTLYETFWCFKKLHDKTLLSIQRCIEEEVDPLVLETPQKLIAQSYNLASLTTTTAEENSMPTPQMLIIETKQEADPLVFETKEETVESTNQPFEVSCIKEEIDRSPQEPTTESLEVRRAKEKAVPFLETIEQSITQAFELENLMSGPKESVQELIRNKYPCAYFVQSYAHDFNHLIQRAVSRYSKVRQFFNDLSAIPAFFSDSSHRCDVFDEIIWRKLPGCTAMEYNTRTVNFVYENRELLTEVLEEIEDKCSKDATTKDACNLRRALDDPDFTFWLHFFQRLMPHVDCLYNQIQSRNKSRTETESDISNFANAVIYLRCSIDNTEDDRHRFAKRKRTEPDRFRSACAKDVCDTVVSLVKDGLSYRGHLEAAELVAAESFPEFSEAFPVGRFDAVCSAYPFLRKPLLRTELEFVYARHDFRYVSGVANLLTLLVQTGLNETFPETTRLVKVVLTTPMATAEPERCFGTLERAKRFLVKAADGDRTNALAMLSVNKQLVDEIDDFEDKVLEKFVAVKDVSGDFSFKK